MLRAFNHELQVYISLYETPVLEVPAENRAAVQFLAAHERAIFAFGEDLLAGPSTLRPFRPFNAS